MPDNSLAHHGVKGMKWGVTASPSARKKKKMETASDDVKQVNASKDKIKEAKGVHALSNKELQSVVTRMNLERQYSQLIGKEKKVFDRGHDKVKKLIGPSETYSKAFNFANSDAGKALANALVKVAL